MKRLMLAAAVTVFLSACGSSVKLDDVPVEDKAATSGVGLDGKASGAGVGQSSVTGVDVRGAAQTQTAAAAQAGNRIVYFDFDSAAIRPEFQPLIESHAQAIKTDKSKKVAIEGHTDERGSREYNLALGQRRAEAVRRALGLLGASDEQMEAVSFGEEKPAEIGSSEDAMAKNRRAEISYR